MRMEAVEVALPSRKVSNAEVLALIREHSTATFAGDLDKTLRHIRHCLHYSGARIRRWLAPGETPISLIGACIDKALATAGCSRDDIDLLLYAGVDRGFNEPSNANLIASTLGLPNIQCFDILEACNGWSRALQLSYALISAGFFRRILILNGEFNMFAGGAIFPVLFKLHNPGEVICRLPAYTLGEAATATIVSNAESEQWEFFFCGRNDFADLCTVPLPGYERYCNGSDRIGRNGIGAFTSFGHELFTVGTDFAMDVFRRLQTPRDEIRAIFPHAASKRVWNDAAASLGVEHLMYYIYPEYGNLVSASVPAAIAKAVAERRVRRGDRIVGWVASAGMSFAAYSFEY